jgi:hypothetical protein
VRFGDQVVLGAWPGTVNRAQAGFGPPFSARTWELSPAQLVSDPAGARPEHQLRRDAKRSCRRVKDHDAECRRCLDSGFTLTLVIG